MSEQNKSEPTEFDKAFMELMKHCKTRDQAFRAMLSIFTGIIFEIVQGQVTDHLDTFHKEQVENESGKSH